MPHAAEAYPLSWPVGWPRVKFPGRPQFAERTLFHARELLERELRLLHATDLVLSTNIPLRLDGLPYSGAREPADHGAAVYFRLKGQPRVLACDKWNKVAFNVIAMAKHVEAMRGQLRWGVGSVEQAFAGYKALPEMPARRAWHEVLGVPAHAPWDEIKRRRLWLLEREHPDKGGRADVAAEINAAFAEVARERGQAAG